MRNFTTILSVLALCLSGVVAQLEWEQTATLTTEATGYFGHVVAVDDKTMALTALYDGYGGTVHIYTLEEDVWTLEAELTEPDGTFRFGYSLALQGDTLIVGAAHRSIPGAVYVYTRSGGVWTEETKLSPNPDGVDGETFGSDVDIDGNTLVVADRGLYDHKGSVYIYERSEDGQWELEDQVTGSDVTTDNDRFGNKVAVYGDTLIVSSVYDDHSGERIAGSVYAFVKEGARWIEQAKVTKPDPEYFDLFGHSLSLEGETMVVGAIKSGDNVGSVHVIVRDGGVWTEQAELIPSDAIPDMFFGVAVDMKDGVIAVAAQQEAPEDDGDHLGWVYLFVREGEEWTEQAKLTTHIGKPVNRYGITLTLAMDEKTVVVGDPLNNGDSFHEGAAYVFEYSIDAPDPSAFVRKFVLFNSNTDKRVAILEEGDVFDQNDIGRALNVKAVTEGSVDSVVFELNSSEYSTDNAFPYTLLPKLGSPPGDHRRVPELAQAGTYTVTATPYSGPEGTGTAGTSSSITFTLI